jgi:hypothetical protein
MSRSVQYTVYSDKLDYTYAILVPYAPVVYCSWATEFKERLINSFIVIPAYAGQKRVVR